MAISRRLAGLMNGELTVVSRLGQGSTFSLILREVEPARGEPEPAAEAEWTREAAPEADAATPSPPVTLTETMVTPEQDEWLRHEMAPAMAALNRAFRVDEAITLALRLKEWGREAQIVALTRLAERLGNAARRFDVSQVRATAAIFLERFPVVAPRGKSD